ncbi:restriction endonuclease subunit S [Succinivibrio sp. AGMB01872]|uniref:Restriction endonuclease subunit S n=2 Tax=Succinivibrio faecicola TaxID=2820300 RepID=A0ABS7DEX6_9GAMM|nr:restriction endonuclease subunit S [Succinivibrio faecicola]MBW7569657.1 restriction endonuclease subunit S [Succinivibrio faecicola]
MKQVFRLFHEQITYAWEQRKLGNIGSTYTGLSGKNKDDFGHGDAKFITYLNIFNNAIADPEQLESIEIDPKQNEIKYGDIFFTTSSETPEEVGMSSIWLQNQANVYLNSFCFGYRPIIDIDPYFMAFNLRSESIRKKFMFLAQGISRYNISKNKVMEMEICLPCLAEQKKIGAFFFKLDNLITLQQRKYIFQIT